MNGSHTPAILKHGRSIKGEQAPKASSKQTGGKTVEPLRDEASNPEVEQLRKSGVWIPRETVPPFSLPGAQAKEATWGAG